MRSTLAIYVVISLAGCGGNPAPPANPISDLQNKAKEVSAAIGKQNAAEKKLLADLKADPKPVAALALDKARERYAEQFGDDAVSSAQITVDESTIKTFGGAKWTVQGGYSGKDSGGTDRALRWQVTAQVMFGKLQVRSIDLDAED